MGKSQSTSTPEVLAINCFFMSKDCRSAHRLGFSSKAFIKLKYYMVFEMMGQLVFNQTVIDRCRCLCYIPFIVIAICRTSSVFIFHLLSKTCKKQRINCMNKYVKNSNKPIHIQDDKVISGSQSNPV